MPTSADGAIDLTPCIKDSTERAVPEVGRLKLRYGGEKREKVFYVDGDPVKPDLVFTSSRGDWIVAEPEKGDPPLEGTEQAERYVRALQQNRKESVIGLFVTGRPESRGLTQHVNGQIRTLRSGGPDVRWLWYDVDIRLQDPSPRR
jgi:hypothetical protein